MPDVAHNMRLHCLLDPLTARFNYGDCKVLLTFESMDEILWCDHSNETSLAVLSHGTFCFAEFEEDEI